jgi:hypothetical protein
MKELLRLLVAWKLMLWISNLEKQAVMVEVVTQKNEDSVTSLSLRNPIKIDHKYPHILIRK